jgi:hypothetical protein
MSARTTVSVGLILVVMSTAMVRAQVGPALLLQPWERLDASTAGKPDASEPAEAAAMFRGDALFQFGTDIQDTRRDVNLAQYLMRGRVKLTDEPGAGPALGFQYNHFDIDTDDPRLPGTLRDGAVALAGGFDLDEDWRLGLVGGVGYAGDSDFDDADAVYFMGDLILSKTIDERSSLTMMLDYHGNRAIFPDVPLPAISYAARVSDTLSYTLGLPFSSLTWEFAPDWTVRARYAVVYNFDVRLEYAPADAWTFYGALENRTDAFMPEGNERDRLFFEQSRLEAGVVWTPCPHTDLILAGGYAFNQEFSTGFDARDRDTVRELDDAPYLRAGLKVNF